MNARISGISGSKATLKRGFDIILAIVGLALTFWLIVVAWLVATLDTLRNGFFLQERVGKDGRIFKVIKIRTMRPLEGVETTVTRAGDARITRLGCLMRRLKIDEVPQLINVLKGDMSFVGPRPDVPGFADRLQGEERLVLSVRPGITGPATLRYRNEEDILAEQEDPEAYNRDFIYPDKVRINLEYIRHWRLIDDMKYIWQTITG